MGYLLSALIGALGSLIGIGMKSKNDQQQRANAHQIEVADLQKSGLNPAMAQGMAGAPITDTQFDMSSIANGIADANKSYRNEKLEREQMKADADKTKAEAELNQAKADEIMRHNKETEQIQRENENAKNRLLNKIIDKFEGKGSSGNDTIDLVVEKAKEEGEKTKENIKGAWGAIARGEIVDALDKASDVHPVVRGAKKKVKEGVKKVKDNGGWKATGQKIGEKIKGAFKKK